MKALLLTAPSKLELVDFPKPQAKEGEVVLRVRACGICGSDIHGWDGSTGRRSPPLIMGHEASGEVASVGPKVEKWKPGDRVTFDSTLFCGDCYYCRKGLVALCENRKVVGVSPAEYKQHGAFAEYLAVPQRVLYRMPETMGFEQAAMVEPVSIAVHAVRRPPIGPADTVAVVGSGMIGLFVIQALRWIGVQRIIAIDLEDKRLALARELGATETIRADSADVPGQIAALTEGRGADVTFEVVGITPAVQLAMNSVRRGGSVVLVGNLSPKVDFPLQIAVTRELTVYGSTGSSGEYPMCIDLIARGIIRTEPMVSAVAPLDEGKAWFERLSEKGAGSRYMKVILKPVSGPSDFSLAGRIALVTGSSRGLGQGFALGLARAGADVAITSRTLELLAETKRAVEALGRRAFPVVLDVRSQESIQAAVDRTEREFGPIDILINNAGCNIRKPALDVSWEDWNTILDTNLRGPFFVAQAVARRMIPRGRGRMVNIGSVTSVAGSAGLGPYGASRGGIRQLTMSLAADWGPHGITVNCLAPGWFKTAQNAVLYENPEWVSYLVDRIPLRRPGQDGDLEGALVFLASDASRYITGQTLLVDGGITVNDVRALPKKTA